MLASDRVDPEALLPPQQRRARVGSLQEIVVEHNDVSEAVLLLQVHSVNHRRVGHAEVHLVEVEMEVPVRVVDGGRGDG